tara:strand:+ start:6605 stop:8812 length:2208 start_codon:yes stop_codon:yes gene_type:complete
MAEKNILHKFASYNCLFTISSCNDKELQNRSYFKNPLKNIVARSGGISDAEVSANQLVAEAEAARANQDIPALARQKVYDDKMVYIKDRQISEKVLEKGRDIFIENVNILSTASPSFERNLGTFTKIDMALVEPYGISLIEKLRGATAKEGYIDYLDAPMLLTLQIKGQDENGNFTTTKEETITRKIPILIARVEFDVTESGTEYRLEALPYCEMGYDDRFKFPRRDVQAFIPHGGTYQDWADSVEFAINSSGNADETARSQMDVEIAESTRKLPDVYKFHLHPELRGKLTYDKMSKEQIRAEGTPLSDNKEFAELIDGASKVPPYKGGAQKGITHKFSDSFPQAIENIVQLSDFYREVLENWTEKFATAQGISTTIAPNTPFARDKTTKELIGDLKKLKPTDDVKSYARQNQFVDWFRIVVTVSQETGTANFDPITRMHPKTINYTVVPYKVHINKFLQPGLHLAKPKDVEKNVRKNYNYIFTGENLDVLGFNINYKAAFFVRNVRPTYKTDQEKGGLDNKKDSNSWFSELVGGNKSDQYNLKTLSEETKLPFNLRGAPSNIKSKNAVDESVPPRMSAFMDYLTNPDADMLQLDMEILGDPAYISEDSFDPSLQNAFKPVDSDFDLGKQQFKYNSYMPIIGLNFRFPGDPQEQKGVYFDRPAQNTDTSGMMFNGLYQLVKVDSKFEGGKFTQDLRLVRLLNQDSTEKTDASQAKDVHKINVNDIDQAGRIRGGL